MGFKAKTADFLYYFFSLSRLVRDQEVVPNLNK